MVKSTEVAEIEWNDTQPNITEASQGHHSRYLQCGCDAKVSVALAISYRYRSGHFNVTNTATSIRCESGE